MQYEHNEYLMHYGIKGQKWGIRKYQNEDGSLTPEGLTRYSRGGNFVGRWENRVYRDNRRHYAQNYRVARDDAKSRYERGDIGRDEYRSERDALKERRDSNIARAESNRRIATNQNTRGGKIAVSSTMKLIGGIAAAGLAIGAGATLVNHGKKLVNLNLPVFSLPLQSLGIGPADLVIDVGKFGKNVAKIGAAGLAIGATAGTAKALKGVSDGFRAIGDRRGRKQRGPGKSIR